jgi:hypothetical protein
LINDYSISLISDRDQGESKRKEKRNIAKRPLKKLRIVEFKKGDKK